MQRPKMTKRRSTLSPRKLPEQQQPRDPRIRKAWFYHPDPRTHSQQSTIPHLSLGVRPKSTGWLKSLLYLAETEFLSCFSCYPSLFRKAPLYEFCEFHCYAPDRPASPKSSIDVETFPTGMRIADKVFHTCPFKEKRKWRVFLPPDMNMSEPVARRKYVRRHSRTEYHPVGTARLGRLVDEKLKSHGRRG